jgi:hypothetical protein
MRRTRLGSQAPRMLAAVAALLAVSMALAGCPRLRVAEVRLAGPAKGGKLTLVANVETEYQPKTCPAQDADGQKGGSDCTPEPSSYSGRGVVAVWLPAGWKAVAARVRAPGKAQAEAMPLEAEVAPEFPGTFPHQPGEWWPFVTSDQEIPAGNTVYPVEVDLEGPAGAKDLTMGVALGAVSDCAVGRKVGEGDIEDPPTEVTIDLRTGKVAVRDRVMSAEVQLPGCEKARSEPAPDAGTGQKAEPEPARGSEPLACDCNCPKIPPVDRGARGCSCDAAGSATPAIGLVPMILGAIWP